MVVVVFHGSWPYLVVQHKEMNYVFCVSKPVNNRRERAFL